MHRRSFLTGSVAGVLTLAAGKASAQDVITLRMHLLVPLESSIVKGAITPFFQAIEAEAGGRVKIEMYPSMQLGGSPLSLYDQVKDGVVDFTQTAIGYSPGRFPKTETIELPFLMSDVVSTSVALQKFVEAHSMDEFSDVKLLAINVHGPGLLHTKDPVTKLEDLRGMKIRGGSPVVNDLMAKLGAEPITLPITQMAEALTTGVIDGTTMPWDLTPSLKIPELIHNHTEFASGLGLYTLALPFVMNLAAYQALPDDIRALFDKYSGVPLARACGEATAPGDVWARQIAVDLGNTIHTLDEAETQRWIDAAQPTIEQWYAEREAKGIDGRALHQAAKELIMMETKSG
jgi:TRAP-type C4-dicarboxylate transport system substrate-binding protein